MKRIIFALGVLSVVSLTSCDGKESLLGDKEMRKSVMERLEEQKKLASGRYEQLFSVFDNSLSETEKEALSFLYAYMPLSDLSNHDGEFFLQHVRYALKARAHFPWGKHIPDDIFLHYVLPHRVNNEYLDTARMVFFRELKDRLSGLTMREAALEINHWCHEKVTYRSTDYRTSSPLNTVKTAYGRCGEQSTFTVAAMRAAGIPARQIYSPRWAHTNDNHAWVEVWVDGEWYFMGACEPEPELNMGWFETPATRAMLLHHRTYGHIPTMEEIVTVNRYYTEVNVLDRYAPVKKIFVKVEDENGTPLEGAVVDFHFPNFAEFYSLASVKTDERGVCDLMTGRGDLMVWCQYNGRFSRQKLLVSVTDTLKLIPGKFPFSDSIQEHLFHAPPPSPTPDHSGVDRTGHIKRLHREDSLRAAYEQTFIDSVEAVGFAIKNELQVTTTVKLFKQSRGNWQVVKQFLEYAAPKDPDKALALLSVISPKDRRDTPLNVLKDHFNYSGNPANFDSEIFYRYILNPRIRNELISGYKERFQNYFSESFKEKVRDNIEVLAKWVHDSIETNNEANPWGVPQLPCGVLEIKVADTNSLNIFFIAVARSFGIPARIDAVRNQPQVFQNGKWIDVNPEKGMTETHLTGTIDILFENDEKSDFHPVYYKDFTLAKFSGNSFKTLDYSKSDVFGEFPSRLELDKGFYLLTTVKRLSDGSIKTRERFFDIGYGDHLKIRMIIPDGEIKDDEPVKLDVGFNKSFEDFTTKENITLKELTGNAGVVLVWLDTTLEPSKHLLNDLIRLRSNFNNWDGKIALLMKSDKITPGFRPSHYVGLPERAAFYIDRSDLLDEVREMTAENERFDMPVVFVINPENEIIYESSGYRIGIGDEVLSEVVSGCVVQ